MTPFTHLFVSWTIADHCILDERDRAMVTWAGVIADVDGLTLLPDLFTFAAGMNQTHFYSDYHHIFTHGLPFAVVVAISVWAISHHKLKAILLSLLTFHLHLLCDLVGSRGPDPLDVWPIPYLSPFSDKLTIYYWKQWPLNAWPNIVLSVVLMVLIIWRAYQRGYSPVSLFSKRADQTFIHALRNRFKHQPQTAPVSLSHEEYKTKL